MKRSHLVLVQAVCASAILLTLLGGYYRLSTNPSSPLVSWHPGSGSGIPQPPPSVLEDTELDSNISEQPIGDSKTNDPIVESPHPEAHTPNNKNKTAPYVKAIFDPHDTTLPRLACPAITGSRYDYLSTVDTRDGNPPTLKYYFALDLRQAAGILPRLLGSIVEAIQFLGPESCALSIVEGNSDDDTLEILAALRPRLEKLVVSYFLRKSDIDPSVGPRISKLAELRNLALIPLASPHSLRRRRLSSDEIGRGSRATIPPQLPPADGNTTVIFLNDVAICAEDILELVHQRVFQGAQMTCAMDWTYVGSDPTFYDVWVARTLTGNLFFDIPPDGGWNSAWNLFPRDTATKLRFNRQLPFQVYACWNGAVAFGAGPLLSPPLTLDSSGSGRDGTTRDHAVRGEKGTIGFRGPRDGECYSGEPTLFCKDLWWAGLGRIAVVPSVNLEYSDEAATKIKKAKGFTSKWTEREEVDTTRIKWVEEPPDMVVCMPGLGDTSLRPWNETTV